MSTTAVPVAISTSRSGACSSSPMPMAMESRIAPPCLRANSRGLNPAAARLTAKTTIAVKMMAGKRDFTGRPFYSLRSIICRFPHAQNTQGDKRMLRCFKVVAAIGVVVIAATDAGRAADGLQLRVLSSRPETVTGGDALVRVELPAGVSPSDVKLTVNGTDATRSLKADASARSLMGLVTGFAPGSNTLTASAPKQSSAKLTVVNHPITGPLFSGPQEQPFVCMTDKFKLQGGGTLGPS